MRKTMPFTWMGDFVIAILHIEDSGCLIQSGCVYDDSQQTGRCDGDNDDGEDPAHVYPSYATPVRRFKVTVA
jgi:hypothetical protein